MTESDTNPSTLSNKPKLLESIQTGSTIVFRNGQTMVYEGENITTESWRINKEAGNNRIKLNNLHYTCEGCLYTNNIQVANDIVNIIPPAPFVNPVPPEPKMQNSRSVTLNGAPLQEGIDRALERRRDELSQDFPGWSGKIPVPQDWPVPCNTEVPTLMDGDREGCVYVEFARGWSATPVAEVKLGDPWCHSPRLATFARIQVVF
jgi:hypothetical protein